MRSLKKRRIDGKLVRYGRFEMQSLGFKEDVWIVHIDDIQEAGTNLRKTLGAALGRRIARDVDITTRRENLM